jgi:hypothetical protein
LTTSSAWRSTGQRTLPARMFTEVPHASRIRRIEQVGLGLDLVGNRDQLYLDEALERRQLDALRASTAR